MLLQETQPKGNGYRSATNVNWFYACDASYFHTTAKLELKRPAHVHMHASDIHTRIS